jgi:hypothetical protein
MQLCIVLFYLILLKNEIENIACWWAHNKLAAHLLYIVLLCDHNLGRLG